MIFDLPTPIGCCCRLLIFDFLVEEEVELEANLAVVDVLLKCAKDDNSMVWILEVIEALQIVVGRQAYVFDLQKRMLICKAIMLGIPKLQYESLGHNVPISHSWTNENIPANLRFESSASMCPTFLALFNFC